jgi:hypothetical protein
LPEVAVSERNQNNNYTLAWNKAQLPHEKNPSENEGGLRVPQLPNFIENLTQPIENRLEEHTPHAENQANAPQNDY